MIRIDSRTLIIIGVITEGWCSSWGQILMVQFIHYPVWMSRSLMIGLMIGFKAIAIAIGSSIASIGIIGSRLVGIRILIGIYVILTSSAVTAMTMRLMIQ